MSTGTSSIPSTFHYPETSSGGRKSTSQIAPRENASGDLLAARAIEARLSLVMNIKKMTSEQAGRIQRELLPGSQSVPNGEPFLTYGIWVLPFMKSGMGFEVFLIDRQISSEADLNKAKEEANQKFQGLLARRTV
jgi:hypothetical protein